MPDSTEWAPAVVKVIATLVVLLGGVYAVRVLEAGVAELVSGRRRGVRPLFSAPIREAALLLLQQRTVTERPDAALWALAPALLGAIAAGTLAAVPLSASVVAVDVDNGIVYVGALLALVMVAVYCNGWAANSLTPVVGGYRFVALALSYEMPIALVLIATALPAASLRFIDIVAAQEGMWNIVRQPLGLPLYLVAALGLGMRGPLDVADGADLAGGTAAELSGGALLLWRVAADAVLVAVSAVGATAFLGGWWGPWLPGAVWVALKTLALLSVLLLLGQVVGRVRLERFVVVAWAVLIPVALLDVFGAGLLVLWRSR